MNRGIWNSKTHFNLNDGSEIFLLHDNGYLYVGFRGTYEPWSHFYINKGNDVYVLHPTLAMGRVVYHKDIYGAWEPDRKFNWKLRHPEQTREGKINRENFFDEEGWITFTSKANNEKQLVFKIALKNFNRNNIHIAFVYGMKDDKYFFWPSTLNDATLKPEIFTGYNPFNLRFNFNLWALLKLE